MNASLLVPICFLLFDLLFAEEDCIVEVENGKIRGKRIITSHNKTMYGFLEIPYARPPVGNLRFTEPEPPINWDGVLNSTEITKICWELKTRKKVNKPQENEDCLYINVHIPKLPEKNRELYPVAVYFYGGGFRFGSPMHYTPQLFVESGVIFVTFNFRSGVLGFLTTKDGIIPANLGLKDQNFALKWVQRNIHRFGGDPKQVTLVGHSSGAASVAHHIMSKKSAGLFSAAIVQSANALSPPSLMTNSNFMARQIAKSLSREITENSTTLDIYKLLMETPAHILSNVSFKLPVEIQGSMLEISTGGFGPAIGNSDSKDAFVTGPLYEHAKEGKFNRVPLLIGITSEEVLGFPLKDKIKNMAKRYDKNPQSLVPEMIKMKGKKADYVNEVKNLYTNSTFPENVAAFAKIIGDLTLAFATITQADLHSRFCETYFYTFSVVQELNVYSQMYNLDIKGLAGAGHADELNYFLYDQDGTSFKEEAKKYKTETLKTRYRLAKLWTNFIKHRNPTPEGDPLLQNIVWPKFLRNAFKYLDIGVDLTIKENPRNYKSWTNIFDKYYEHPINFV